MYIVGLTPITAITVIGKMKGVTSVSVKNNDSAVIEYDPARLEVDENRFKQIAREAIERLGFRIKDM